MITYNCKEILYQKFQASILKAIEIFTFPQDRFLQSDDRVNYRIAALPNC